MYSCSLRLVCCVTADVQSVPQASAGDWSYRGRTLKLCSLCRQCRGRRGQPGGGSGAGQGRTAAAAGTSDSHTSACLHLSMHVKQVLFCAGNAGAEEGNPGVDQELARAAQQLQLAPREESKSSWRTNSVSCFAWQCVLVLQSLSRTT